MATQISTCASSTRTREGPRWDRHKEKREKSLLSLKASRKKVPSQNEKVAASKVPLELLAQDWLKDQRSNTELRAYLVENLLPSLVVGLEKLLTEVSLQGLVNDKGENPDFNPINYLAQHLMRNNPKYSNFAEAHPYCRAMHEVSEQLKKIAYAADNEKLVALKSDIKKRRMERESAELAHALEMKRREELVKNAVSKWVLSGKEGLTLAEIQLAVQSWLEKRSDHSSISGITDLFSHLLSMEPSTVTTEANLVSSLMQVGKELSTDLFNSLVDHLVVCGVERKRRTEREQRHALFASVFDSCDPDKTGFVDRLRVLHLFNCFYDSASSDVQDKVNNPRKWPIIEVAEAEELDDDEERRSTSVTASSLSEEDYKEFLCGTGEQGEGAVTPLHKEANAPSQDNPVEDTPKKGADDKPTDAQEEGSNTPNPTTDDTKPEPEASPESTETNQDGPPPEPADETKVAEEESKAITEEKQEPEASTKITEEKQGEPPTESTEPHDEDSKANVEQQEETQPTATDSTDGPEPTTGDTEETKPKEESRNSRAGSVLERRWVTAGRYGRSASISAMRRLSGMASRPVSPSGPGSCWDHFLLNCSQFVQLVELFLASPISSDPVIDALSSFIRVNFSETAQERSERLELAQQQKLILTRRQQVNKLFEVWDNDRSGYLELEELQLVLGRWKGFSNEQAQEHAKEILISLGAQQSRLSRASFHMYIEQLTEGMRLREFEEFSEYLMTSVKLTFEDLRRGEKRKALLGQISVVGKASGLLFSKAMKAAIEAIHEDNAEFGSGKSCSVCMALLQSVSPTNPVPCLLYKAASSDIKPKVVGRKILRSFKQVSFMAVDSSRPVCVQNICKHGGVYFFNQEHNNEEYNGSLVVSPIVTPREAVVGTFSVDTLREVADDGQDNTFLTHEINFYQGVGVCLGEVFHWIEARKKLLTVSKSALSWVHRRCPQVTQSAMYIVEPCQDGESSKCTYALRCMLTTSGPNNQSQTSKLLNREENIFGDYLFQCADNSEPVVANAYGQHHLAYPIRDSTGCAVAVLDLYMPPTQNLRPSQVSEVTKVLKLLTLSYYQLSCVHERPIDTVDSSRPVTTKDSMRYSDQDVSVLFDQLMLTDLKQSVSKLDNRVFAEMRSYIDPPATVLGIVQGLLYILYPDNNFDTWAKCKQYITVSLMSDLQEFDPLSLEENQHKKLDKIKEIFRDIQMESVQEQGSLPAKYIYGWVNVCLSLLEHAANKPSAVDSHKTAPSSAGTATNTPIQAE